MIRALICLLSKQKVEKIQLLSSSPHLRMLKANFSFLDLRSRFLFFLVLYLHASLTNLSNLNVSKCGVLTMHFAPHMYLCKNGQHSFLPSLEISAQPHSHPVSYRSSTYQTPVSSGRYTNCLSTATRSDL